MIGQLVSTIASAVRPDRACQFAQAVNQHDRWFTSQAFARSAEWIRQQFAEAGMVDAEVVQLPADGRTRMQDWTMPLAWDCDHAELRVIRPLEKLICSRQDEPRSVAQWSAPTDGQIVGELRLLGQDLPAGAFALTDRDPRELIKQARDAGAAVLISSYVRSGYPEHRTMWCNALAGEGGWGLLAGQPTLPVFMITPRTGRQLRQLLQRHDRVELAARIDARVGPGTMPVATAVLAGQDHNQEILMLAHGFESGLIDNASGVGAILEAATLLGELTGSGRLARPRRTIRWLITNECYGTLGLLTQRRQIVRRGIAGLNLDTVGDASRADYPFRLHRVGAASPGVGNALAGLILQALPEPLARAYYWQYENELPTADHMISDPLAGITTPWLGRAQEFPAWHCSDDTADLLDPTSMAAAATLAAAYAYFLASAEDEQAAWLAEAMIPLLEDELASRVSDRQPRRLAFWRWALKRDLLQAARLAISPAGRQRVMEIAERWPAEEFRPQGVQLDDPRAQQLVPVRRTWGTLTFESLPPERRSFGSPRWNQRINAAWYWADGVRTVAEIAELVQLELGGQVRPNLTELFGLAAEAGLCQLAQR